MKIITSTALSLVIYFSAFGQAHDMHNMSMPDKESEEKKRNLDNKKMDNMLLKSDKSKAKSSVNAVQKSADNAPSKTVRYDLYVGDTTLTTPQYFLNKHSYKPLACSYVFVIIKEWQTKNLFPH